MVSVNGSITASGGSNIYANTSAQDVALSSSSIVWANNIVTIGSDSASATTARKNTIKMKAQYNIADDLEINAALSDIQLANIEALASGEDPYINACNIYCVYDVQSVCVLFTNKGYTINCYSMRSWM